MISSLDKAILGGVGMGLMALSAGAATFALRMKASDPDDAAGTSAPIAAISQQDGAVKTRPRTTLAWSDAATRQPLREGDRIRTMTGARATIDYGKGLVVSLEPNSQITVYGPIETTGERLVAVNVVDGAIRATVLPGQTLSLRDATGAERGRVKTSGNQTARLELTAPDKVGDAIKVKVVEGDSVAVTSDAGTKTVVVGETSGVGDPATPTPTPTVLALVTPQPTATPPTPLLEGAAELGLARADTPDTRFRIPLPPGVTSVTVQGRAMRIVGGEVELEILNLAPGMNEIDVVYRHADGKRTRQVQRVRRTK